MSDAEARIGSEIISTRPPGADIPSTFTFSPDGSTLLFLDTLPDVDARFLCALNVGTLQKRAVLKPEKIGNTEESLSIEEKLRRERQRLQAIGVTSYAWSGASEILVPLQGSVYILNARSEQPVLVTAIKRDEAASSLDARPCQDGSMIAFVRKGDLWVVAANSSSTTSSLDVSLDNARPVITNTTFCEPVLLSHPSTKGESGLTNGLASFLAQEEFDRQHGYWWSGNGQYIAYEHVDERAIPSFDIVHQSEQYSSEEHRYPFAGKSNPLTYLCLVDVKKRLAGSKDASMVLDLPIAKNDDYLTRVDWYSDDKLFVQTLNREQSNLKLYMFDVTSDPPQKRLLLEEHTNIWINIHDLLSPLSVRKNHFLWGSERSGFMHLYLYRFPEDAFSKETRETTPIAELVTPLTSGDFVVDQVVGIDEYNNLMYFSGNKDFPQERHLYATKLDAAVSVPVRLTPKGTSTFEMDPSGRCFVLTHSSLGQPYRVTLESLPSPVEIYAALASESSLHHHQHHHHNSSSAPGTHKRLKASPSDSHAAMLVPPPKFTVSPTEEDFHIMSLKTITLLELAGMKDFESMPWFLQYAPWQFSVPCGSPSKENNHLLFGQLYAPDPAKFGEGPYPTVVQVYGGPHVQRVKNDWASTVEMRFQRLASRGFLVVKCDNRGSSRRGISFESCVKHNMGTVEIDDQITCLLALAKENLVDLNRVGITGWSYGGYLTCLCLMKRPDVFKVGIAGAPVTQWDGYDSAYTERYMGTPESNPAGYFNGSVMTHVDSLSGNLLLVHGLIDENVHFRHTARLVDALVNARKPHDLLIFPEERHGPRKRSTRVFLEDRMLNYFEEKMNVTPRVSTLMPLGIIPVSAPVVLPDVSQ